MLPEKFVVRMKKLLGDEYADFERALEGSPIRGVRVNTLKISREDFLRKTTAPLTPIPYFKLGFIAESGEGLGSSPSHHAGEIYIQDPGAMSALSSLDLKPGDWVLDLCAAPGGKSTQAAAMIGDDGFLLSNEYVPKRAKICVSNFERLGLRNAMVTSLDTSEFPKLFDTAFDLVILDAPCSGEGMFRKNDTAIDEWSEENVINSAKRQRDILNNAASLVRDGGHLLYSTCTYSLEENEMNVDAFLKEHPDYTLVPVKEELKLATKDGICFAGAENDMTLTRRFYPHVSRGEGQFVALMKRSTDTKKKTILYKSELREPSRDEISAVRNFFKDSLIDEPAGKLCKIGENIILISHGCPPLPHSVFSAGVLLGEVRRGIFHPAHQFFSSYGDLFREKLELDDSDPRLKAYLFGEEIPYTGTGRGYCAVCYGKVPLGGGKISDGRIKNHYPKGLRIMK